jgi:drug/metabolite transporter (DMT)-like permease
VNPYLTGAVLVLISATAFGAMPIFARYAYTAGVDPATLLFIRFTGAGLVLLALTRLRRQPLPQGRVLWAIILMGSVGYFGQALSYFTALTLIPAGLVALLLYLYPALVAFVAALMFKERLTAPKAGALVLALAGAALVIAPQGGMVSSGQVQPLGIVLGLLAAVIYSGYILVGSRIIKHAAPAPVSMVIMFSAAVSFAGLLAVRRLTTGEGLHLPQTAGGWWAVAGLTLIATVLAMVTFLAGIERIGPTSGALLSTLEPAVSVVLAVLLLGEGLSPLQAAGGTLILSAVFVLTGGEKKRASLKVERPAG